MSQEQQIETILRLIPPTAEGFSEAQARSYLKGLDRRKLKRELSNAKKHVATKASATIH